MSFADNLKKQKTNDADSATKFFIETKTAATKPETKAKQKRVSVILNDTLFEKLSKVTKEKGVSKNAYIIMALDEYLKNE